MLNARAYILINVEPGSEAKVLKELRKMNNVEEAYLSYGVYDLVIRVKADNMEELKTSVTHGIRTIDQVRSTLTLILM